MTSSANELPQLRPADEHNQKLELNVHPPDWVNPKPAARYNLVVIGAGTAGLVTAAGAAGLGAKVALIERDLMGGDCLNVGCVPSKAIISAARAAAAVRDAGEFGVHVPDGTHIDFATVMSRMRRLRADISHLDSAARFRELGVDVFLGNGKFVSEDIVAVGDGKLRFKKAVIATGARASAPPIEGLDQVEYLTNETLFSLTELPKRFGIIGAGPIGCEMAQAFARLGSQVYLVETTHGIMPREDREAAGIVEESILRDGVQLLCCGHDTKVSKNNGGGIRLQTVSHGQSHDIELDQLLAAVGRAPNVEGLNLEKVGVEYDSRTGVAVNDRLQTTNRRIFAAGDICSDFKFTHAADFMARTVIQNALFMGRAKASALSIPWSTYTSPELAHVGLNEELAKQRGIEIDSFSQSLEHVDRAILENETNGIVKIHVRKGTDSIVGATIVAASAGDMISEVNLAMAANSRVPRWLKMLRLAPGFGLQSLGSVIHPYPTQADAVRKTGDLYNRTRLTPRAKYILGKWLSWTR